MTMFRSVLNKVTFNLETLNFIWLGEGAQITSTANFKSLLRREVCFLEPPVLIIFRSVYIIYNNTTTIDPKNQKNGGSCIFKSK